MVVLLWDFSTLSKDTLTRSLDELEIEPLTLGFVDDSSTH